MVEEIDGLPPGVLGFRIAGTLDRKEFDAKLMKPIYAAVERGEQLRVLIELADGFHGLELGALREDLKGAGTIGVKQRSSWERFALLTDKDWIRTGVKAFGWASPGELKLCEPGERDKATAWVVG
jgi:hypothetical protein